jgi:hypothetical protein
MLSSSTNNRAVRRREARKKAEEDRLQQKEFEKSIHTINLLDRDTGTIMQCIRSTCSICNDNSLSEVVFDADNYICINCKRYKATIPFVQRFVDKILNGSNTISGPYHNQVYEFARRIEKDNSDAVDFIREFIYDATIWHSRQAIEFLNDLRSTKQYLEFPKSSKDEDRLILTFTLIKNNKNWSSNYDTKGEELLCMNDKKAFEEFHKFIKSGKV